MFYRIQINLVAANDITTDDIMLISDAARTLNVPPQAVATLLDNGTLTPIVFATKAGATRRVVLKNEVETLKNKRSQAPQPPCLTSPQPDGPSA